MTILRAAIHGSAAVLLITSVTACRLDAQEQREGQFEQTLTVNGPVTLEVRTGSGSVQIRRGPGQAVHVRGRIRGRSSWQGSDVDERIRRIEDAPPITQNGDAIQVGLVREEKLYSDISISYDVTVPMDTQVQSYTGSGEQTISGLSGPLDVRAGSGSLVLRGISSDVTAATGSGAIQVDSIGGSFVGRAGSGRISAQQVGGAVNARTGSGSVDVTQSGEADVEVVTGSGRIGVRGARRALRAHAGSGSIDLEGRPAQNWDVKSASGSIRILFPADAAFDVTARTASGAINITHPLTDVDARSRKSLRATVRGGGPRVDLSTASGSIQID